jgi:hypothetical protein
MKKLFLGLIFLTVFCSYGSVDREYQIIFPGSNETTSIQQSELDQFQTIKELGADFSSAAGTYTHEKGGVDTAGLSPNQILVSHIGASGTEIDDDRFDKAKFFEEKILAPLRIEVQPEQNLLQKMITMMCDWDKETVRKVFQCYDYLNANSQLMTAITIACGSTGILAEIRKAYPWIPEKALEGRVTLNEKDVKYERVSQNSVKFEITEKEKRNFWRVNITEVMSKLSPYLGNNFGEVSINLSNGIVGKIIFSKRQLAANLAKVTVDLRNNPIANDAQQLNELALYFNIFKNGVRVIHQPPQEEEIGWSVDRNLIQNPAIADQAGVMPQDTRRANFLEAEKKKTLFRRIWLGLTALSGIASTYYFYNSGKSKLAGVFAALHAGVVAWIKIVFGSQAVPNFPPQQPQQNQPLGAGIVYYLRKNEGKIPSSFQKEFQSTVSIYI